MRAEISLILLKATKIMILVTFVIETFLIVTFVKKLKHFVVFYA